MRTKLIFFVVMGSALLCALSYSHAEDGANRESSLLIGEGLAPTADSLDYQFLGSPGQSGGSPTMVDQRESGRFILSKTAGDTTFLTERFGHLGIGDSIIIPQTTSVVPQDLWSLNTDVGTNHHFDNGRDLGLTAGVGSDSDHPFYSIHETVFRAGVNYRIPSREHNAWLLFLTYSNNRHFLNGIPLPGAGYFFQTHDDHLEGLVGFPFVALRYKPTPEWNAQFSVFGPRNVNAEIARRLVGPLRIYSGFQWGSQEWLITDRADYSNRLIFEKKRIALGLRSPLPHGFLIDLSGGRQFDQRFFVNDSSSYSGVPTAGLRPTWFIQTRLAYRFAIPEALADAPLK